MAPSRSGWFPKKSKHLMRWCLSNTSWSSMPNICDGWSQLKWQMWQRRIKYTRWEIESMILHTQFESAESAWCFVWSESMCRPSIDYRIRIPKDSNGCQQLQPHPIGQAIGMESRIGCYCPEIAKNIVTIALGERMANLRERSTHSSNRRPFCALLCLFSKLAEGAFVNWAQMRIVGAH